MDYFLSCFGRSKPRDNEREPLLPKHTNARGADLNGGSPLPAEPSERSVVDKFLDVLAALEAGKVPSQDQISGFLQVLLKSELLKEDRGKVVPGNGPTSQQGRKVLRDVKALIQALLQFGMEKNEDDKLQELYFQIVQIDSPSPVQVNLEASSTYRAGQTALDATKQAEWKDHAPMTEQLAFDAATFLHALRTLCETCIFSPLFRLILIDLLSIARDLVRHAAADVERAALHVEQAIGVTGKMGLSNHDDIIATMVTSGDVKEKGKEVAGKVTEVAQEIKDEWQAPDEDAADKTKERILERIQEVVSRLQKDKASRSAIRAMLVLMRKYAEKISSASETASEVLSDVLKQTKDSFNSVDDMQTPNYAPHPYGSLKREKIGITCDAVLSDLKDMLQRLAGGHSSDGMLCAFDRVVRDLDEVPLVLVDEVNKRIEENPTPSDNTEPQPASPPPVVHSTPASPSDGRKDKIKKKKKRKKQKAAEAKESPLSPLSPSEAYIEESPGDVKPIEEEAEKSSITSQPGNPMRTYFSRVGKYLDKALDEPGWATSRDAAKTLEVLYDDGVELVNVVGESVIETVEIVDSNAEEPASFEPKDSRGGVEVRRKFKNDLKSLWVELEAYIAAFEKDKTTMQLFQALDALGGDLSTILSIGGGQGWRGVVESVKHMQGWTPWVGWAIPRIMRMLPAEAIPIPSIEFKTGNIEGALQAIFVQSLVHGQTTSVSVNPIANSLVPDEVVLKEWTEVRIDMADYERPLDGLVGAAPSHQGNSVRTTSRVYMHLDGVRARVEGVGYYFKYTSAFGFGYEDEGVLSVDVGMGSLHDGLGADIEIEIESDSTPFEIATPMFEVPRIIVEGAEEERDDENERPPNLEQNLDMHDNNISGSPSASASVPGAAQPLFRVVDVRITLHGLRFKLDKSRHWILNKLFIQPLAGPIVARVVRKALEERVHKSMMVLANGLGQVRDASRRKEERRVRGLRENCDKQHPQEQGEEFGEESFAEIMANWWGAVIAKGPAIFGRSTEAQEGGANSDNEVEVETQRNAEATAKGAIFTNTTTTTTTSAADQLHNTPAVVCDKPRRPIQVVDLMMEASGTPLPPPPQQNIQQEESVMAIGGGAQLSLGKAGPYGESNGDEERLGGSGKGVGCGLRDEAKKETIGGIQWDKNAVESVEERRQERTQKGIVPRDSRGERTWRSNAFDFK